jgi:hypothetical protein
MPCAEGVFISTLIVGTHSVRLSDTCWHYTQCHKPNGAAIYTEWHALIPCCHVLVMPGLVLPLQNITPHCRKPNGAVIYVEWHVLIPCCHALVMPRLGLPLENTTAHYREPNGAVIYAEWHVLIPCCHALVMPGLVYLWRILQLITVKTIPQLIDSVVSY